MYRTQTILPHARLALYPAISHRLHARCAAFISHFALESAPYNSGLVPAPPTAAAGHRDRTKPVQWASKGADTAGCFSHAQSHWLLKNSGNPPGKGCHGRDLQTAGGTSQLLSLRKYQCLPADGAASSPELRECAD